MTEFAYIVLMCSTLSSLLFRTPLIPISGFLISAALAFFSGIMLLDGVIALVVMGGLCYSFYNLPPTFSWLKPFLLGAIFVLVLAFMRGFIPGFSSLCPIVHEVLVPRSVPFTMCLKIGSTLACAIIFFNSGLQRKEKALDTQSLTVIAFAWALALAALILPALAAGHIAWQPSLPTHLPIWMANNLLLVCFREEVVYRAFLYQNLEKCLKTRWGALIVSSAIFGLLHFEGGLPLIILSAIAGLCYGWAYMKTQRLSAAILTHFFVNLSHILLFTYPALLPGS